MQAGLGGFPIRGRAANDFAGRQVSGAGDVDGVGFGDLLVGARLADARYASLGRYSSGAAYVVFAGGGVGSTPRFLRGDCDASGRIDLTDAVCMLNWLFLEGPAPDCVAATNSDGVGQVAITDAIYLLNHLYLEGPAPPQPYPACGTSELPSDGALGCETPPESCGR